MSHFYEDENEHKLQEGFEQQANSARYIHSTGKSIINIFGDSKALFSDNSGKRLIPANSESDDIYYVGNSLTGAKIQYSKEEDIWREIDDNGSLNEWIRLDEVINKDTTFIVVLGETGKGKSSLIKLLTKNPSVKTETSNACTKESAYYAPLKSSDIRRKHKELNIAFIDTMEIQDTENKCDDETILNAIVSTVNELNCDKVEFIWMVGNSSKKSSIIQTQAKFIEKFGINPYNNNNNNNNVWDSVLMIVSKPTPCEELLDCAHGAIQTSIDCGANQNQWKEQQNLIGYTNIDWIENDKKRQKFKNKYEKDKQDRDNHYYTNNEVETMVCKILSNYIKPIQIIFRNFQCSKCDLICDKRFISPKIPCHPNEKYNAKWVHCHQDKSLILNHISNINKEKTKIKKIHYGQFRGFHDKQPQYFKHRNNAKLIWYHPEKTKYTTFGKFCVGGVIIGACAATGGVVHAAGAVVASTTTIATVTEAATVTTVTTATTTTTATTVATASGGVLTSILGVITAGLGYIGVKECEIYMCCNRDKNEKGCKRGYNCCGNSSGSQGCIAIPVDEVQHPCCNASKGSLGCCGYYQCCKQRRGSKGCQTVCANCNQNIMDKTKNKKCGFKWECCDVTGNLQDGIKPENYKCCITRCYDCNGIFGKSEGCDPDAVHNMEPLQQPGEQNVN